jgi:hypothetical protein
VPHLSGGLQNIENEEEFSDIENREGSGGSKSQRPVERDGLAIERMEETAEDLRMAHKRDRTRS